MRASKKPRVAQVAVPSFKDYERVARNCVKKFKSSSIILDGINLSEYVISLCFVFRSGSLLRMKFTTDILRFIPLRAIRALIQGRVQGVFFRVYTREKAHELNLTGWVRNNPNGTVECQVQGPDTAIEKFIQFLYRGSPSARVDDVTITDIPIDPQLQRFRITY